MKIFYYADYLSHQHLLIPGAWPVSAAADITQCLVNIVTDPSVVSDQGGCHGVIGQCTPLIGGRWCRQADPNHKS